MQGDALRCEAMVDLPRNERLENLTFRVPSTLRARIEAYAASLTPRPSMGAAIRALVEMRLDDLDRRRKVAGR